MAFESKHVSCEYCKGGSVLFVPTLTAAGILENIPVPCPGCDGTGTMEIRKAENTTEWASKCLTCEGKGFNDSWDHQREEHSTDDCLDCDATGVSIYLKLVG